jgi:hypothetical protein
MSLQTLGMIAVATVCAGILWTAAKYFYAAYQLRNGNAMAGRKRLPDAPVPESMAGVESSVLQLGFVPKMKMRYRLVGQPKPTVTWIYEHPEHQIELDLVETPGQPPFWVGLETRFDDGALLHTSYPRGQTIDAPQVKVNYAAYTLQDAFDHHLLTQIGWTELHGEALPLETDTEAFFAQSISVGKQHGLILYRQASRQYVGGGVAMIGYIFIIIGIASQALSGAAVFSFNFLTFTTLSFLIGLALAVGGNGWANRGKPLPAVDADKAPVADPNVHPLNRPVRTI